MRLFFSKYNFWFLCFYFIASVSLYAQDFQFRHCQVENGLSYNSVFCTLQDEKGFLWFGTRDGLNRFDGYTFKIFRNDPADSTSIGGNYINCLFEDASGSLWVGTQKGLYRYHAASETFTALPSTQTSEVKDIEADASGNLWFVANYRLFKWDTKTAKTISYESKGNPYVTSVCRVEETVWVATAGGTIEKYNAQANTFQSFDIFKDKPAPVNQWIEKIYAGKNGLLFIGTSNQGAKLFDTKTGIIKDLISFNRDGSEIYARDFAHYKGDAYLIGTETGMYLYDLKNGTYRNITKKYSNPYSLSDNAVYTVYKDREEGLWIGTYFGGLNHYPKQYTFFEKMFPEPKSNSLSGNVVSDICQDRYGAFWIGTEDAGLNKFDPATKRFTHYAPDGTKTGLAHTNIHGLLADGDELWVGSYERGLDVLNIKTGNVLRHYNAGAGEKEFHSNFITTFYKASTGEMYMGTWTGLYRYNRNTDDFTTITQVPPNSHVFAVTEDGEGTIWCGTKGEGVFYFHPNTGKSGRYQHAKNKNSLTSNYVNDVLVDSYNNLWMATEDGGLSMLNRTTGTFTTYTVKEGLPSNFLFKIIEDAEQRLWVSTSKGLVRLDPLTGKITVYSKANGLLNDQFNFNSGYKDKNGNIYFGSVKGLISFQPKAFSNDAFVPSVYITGFQVHNKELPIQKGSPLTQSIIVTEALPLPYQQSSFSIDFAALNYTAPERTEYAYKMEGLEEDWTYLKTNRKAYFTNLAAGSYVFKVKAANSSGIWSQRETTLSITVLPPLRATRWAYALYTIAAAALLYFLVRQYHNRVEEKNRRKIELLHYEKEKEIYETKLEFFTNIAHEIRTPLTLIKGPVDNLSDWIKDVPQIEKDLKILRRNTDRLIDLTNQLLDFRKTEIKGYSLSFAQVNINELLQDHYNSFGTLAKQRAIEFTLNMPPSVIYADADVDALSKILSNLFSNAVKYADKKVNVQLQRVAKNDIFRIGVANDGFVIPSDMKEKIFEPFFRLKETEKQQGTGIGLALARSLTSLHKGKLYVNGEQTTMNEFILELPLHPEGEVKQKEPDDARLVVLKQ